MECTNQINIYIGRKKYVESPGMKNIDSIEIECDQIQNENITITMEIDVNETLTVTISSEETILGKAEFVLPMDEMDEHFNTIFDHFSQFLYVKA